MNHQHQSNDPPVLGQLSAVQIESTGSSARPETATTWAEIVAIEPRIAAILAEARALRSPNWIDYARFKAGLSKVVGQFAQDPRLATPEAYNVVIRELVRCLRL